jgi:membrane dipeptidase
MVNFIGLFVPAKGPQWELERAAMAEQFRAKFDGEAATRALEEWTKANPMPRGTVADVANHIDHIRKVAGIDHVGIGSDFFDDGKLSMAEGLENPSTFPRLFAELMRRGYSDEDLRKIASGNLLRAMRAMEQTAARLSRLTGA